jgi:hypothetical protein
MLIHSVSNFRLMEVTTSQQRALDCVAPPHPKKRSAPRRALGNNK